LAADSRAPKLPSSAPTISSAGPRVDVRR
jgi:hypothetical protein